MPNNTPPHNAIRLLMYDGEVFYIDADKMLSLKQAKEHLKSIYLEQEGVLIATSDIKRATYCILDPRIRMLPPAHRKNIEKRVQQMEENLNRTPTEKEVTNIINTYYKKKGWTSPLLAAPDEDAILES